MYTKFTPHDYLIAALIGFLAGTFLIPAFLHLGFRYVVALLTLPWVLAPLVAGGLWITQYFSRWISFLPQFGKFAATGLLNTSIDFGVLNTLSAFTGISAGYIIGGVNVPGFSVAVINAYLWNKFWVFGGSRRQEGIFHDFPKFLMISGAGLLLNSSVIIFLTTFVSVSFLSPQAWLNIAKVCATFFSLIWNFIGYKFVVFQAQKDPPPPPPSPAPDLNLS